MVEEISHKAAYHKKKRGWPRRKWLLGALFIVNEMLEKPFEHAKSAFVCFIDRTMAFDEVRRNVFCK